MNEFKPRRLRIVEPGLDTYTGLFGIVDFVDGVSVGLVNWREAQMLGANVRIRDADDHDHQVSPVSDFDRMRHTPADAPIVKAVDTTIEKDGETVMVAEHFTREDLEKIAEEKGLSGVRTIANGLGRTGRSIQQCIDAIMEAQGDNPAQSTIDGPKEGVTHAS